MFATQMDLAKTVLGDARRLQQHLVQRRVLSLRDGPQRVRRELIGSGAEIGLDCLARRIEPARDHVNIDREIAAVRGGIGRGGRWDDGQHIKRRQQRRQGTHSIPTPSQICDATAMLRRHEML
jgi:hypothetical protein